MEKEISTDLKIAQTTTGRLWQECTSLLNYAIKEGKPLESEPIAILQGTPPSREDTDTLNALLICYNHLTEVVKPTSPRTIVQLELAEQKPTWLRILGPLPIIRQFMIAAILSLVAMISISLSPELNVKTIGLSMLQGSGTSQMVRLAFLIACASVGASFYALFKMNGYMAKGIFNISMSHTYWSRFVLGIVAGLLLSELFVAFVEPVDPDTAKEAAGPLDSLAFLLKPVLAILGGFSANLVYRILNKLVSTVETLFKGETDDIIAQKEFQAQLAAEERSGKLQTKTANQLLDLKQALVSQEVPQEVLNQLDQTLADIVGKNTLKP